jgi:hypothetical protein
MTNEQKQEMISMVTALYLSRGQAATAEMISTWVNFIKDYDIDAIRKAFTQYIKYGDNFPSLPAVIRLIERKPDAETASLIAWKNVRKAMQDSTTGNLTKSEKKTLLTSCTGLTEAIEADGFKLGVIERDFKRLFVAMEQGLIEQPKLEANQDVKKIAGNFAKLPFPS